VAQIQSCLDQVFESWIQVLKYLIGGLFLFLIAMIAIVAAYRYWMGSQLPCVDRTRKKTFFWGE